MENQYVWNDIVFTSLCYRCARMFLERWNGQRQSRIQMRITFPSIWTIVQGTHFMIINFLDSSQHFSFSNGLLSRNIGELSRNCSATTSNLKKKKGQRRFVLWNFSRTRTTYFSDRLPISRCAWMKFMGGWNLFQLNRTFFFSLVSNEQCPLE